LKSTTPCTCWINSHSTASLVASDRRFEFYMPIAIVVHGGAGQKPAGLPEAFQDGCKEAAMICWRILQEGGFALDAVEAAVRSLEDNPIYNAGTGASLSADGNIQLDAGIMEGHTLRVGAVANVEIIKNPISLARKVMESPHVLLVGKGAQEFAQEQGISLCRFEDLLTEARYNQWKEKHASVVSKDEPRYHRYEVNPLPRSEEKQGTVGAVALDTSGILAAGASTAGKCYKHPGRVVHSVRLGCVFYTLDH